MSRQVLLAIALCSLVTLAFFIWPSKRSSPAAARAAASTKAAARNRDAGEFEPRDNQAPARRATPSEIDADELVDLVDTSDEAAGLIASIFDDESLSPEEQRPAFLSALQTSGESNEEWSARAMDTVNMRVTGSNVRASVKCYRAGCYAELEAASRRELQAALGIASERDPLNLTQKRWEGGSIATPIETPSANRFIAALILLRP